MADDIDYFKNRYPELKAFLEATEENELERLARGLKSDYLSYDDLSSALSIIAMFGSLPHLNALIKKDQESNENVLARYNHPLMLAAGRGHLKVVNRLLEFEAVKNAVAADNNRALYWAATGGHLAVVNRLLEFEAVKNVVAAHANVPLGLASKGGHLAVVNRLLELEAVKNVVVANDSYALRMAAERGHLAVVNRLLEFKAVKNAVAVNANAALTLAAAGGHLAVINRLLEFEAVKNAVAADDNYALRKAAAGEHLAVVNRLLEFEAVKDVVAADDNYALRVAATKGHLAVVNRLLELEAVTNAVAAHDNEAFRCAANGGHQAVVDVLLHYPTVFRRAESHQVEYGRYVKPFISTRLELLRQQKQTVEQENPNAVFNIENLQEAQLYYYFIRNLIRQNTPESLAGIQLLLDIPSVKTLVHTESNGLLRLASREGSQAAAAILLQIPAVRELAVQNNFYQHEARGEFNLREVAQDRESSMCGLTVGERKRLEAVEKRYGMQCDESLVAFKELYAELTARYQKSPAFFTNDQGERITLPLTWKDFNKLTLSEKERKKALKGYYQHPEHTAIRYLSKPNRWMAEKAAYVDHNEAETEFWSTFQQYIPLITMLWQAAKDKDIAPIDNYTVETRVELFIKELALIGRAHNWDRTRVREKDGKTEEYDDLQGDKPSCYSGVKRRLFQSVQGHPLMKMLTQEVVREELREFVRQSFKASIGDRQREFKRAYDDYVINLDDADLEKLKELNISEDAQTAFIVKLEIKYGDQFKDDPAFKRSIEDYFKLGDENTNCHAIKLGWVGLDDLLEKSALEAGSMFKPAATHSDHVEDKPKSPRPSGG